MTQLGLDFEPTLTVPQVAEILRVKVDTVRHWRDRAMIDVYVLPTGEVRVPADELKRLMEQSLVPACGPRRLGRPRKKVAAPATPVRDFKAASAGDN